MKTSRFGFAIAFLLLIVSGCKSPDLSKSKHFDNVIIQGAPQFEEQVEKALVLLKTQSPHGYATVTNYIGMIQQHEHSGMNVHHKPDFPTQGNVRFLFSVLVCGCDHS